MDLLLFIAPFILFGNFSGEFFSLFELCYLCLLCLVFFCSI